MAHFHAEQLATLVVPKTSLIDDPSIRGVQHHTEGLFSRGKANIDLVVEIQKARNYR